MGKLNSPREKKFQERVKNEPSRNVFGEKARILRLIRKIMNLIQ